MRALWRTGLVALAVATGACATATPPSLAPAVPWREPEVPRDIASRSSELARYQQAWSMVRSGDLGAAESEFVALVTPAPGFYPAAASLGELRLRSRQFAAAGAFFEQALRTNGQYLPALVGRVDARLGAGEDAGALAALTALVATDPSRADAKARLEVVRLRVSQSELVLAERARAAGQRAEAERHVARARDVTPESSAVLRVLSALELDRGDFAEAERHAREATAFDPLDGAAWAALADVHSATGRHQEAAAAYAKALALENRREWRDRRLAAEDRARAAALPEPYRAIATAPRVTRAQLAALLGVRLSNLLASLPTKSSDVVTDVRGHWASPWILPVVRVGWMDAHPNHTFDPATVVTRVDLAFAITAVLDSMAVRARVTVPPGLVFSDLPRSHAAFRAAQVAVAAGIMTADASRFQPAALVSGPDVLAAIGRLEARVK